MSKGGGTTKTVSDPWKAAQPYILDSFNMARDVANNPAQFYGGQTFLGPTEGEWQSWDQKLGYADSVFGGQPTLKYGDATNALSGILGGVPDYAGVQGAVDAANAPILRQFNEEIIPGLNQKATFMNNDTGGIKALNRVMPALGERMSLNANTLMNDERIRAKDLQFRGLGMFPMIAEMGQYPGNLASEFANWGRGFGEAQIDENMARWDFNQNQPRDTAGWYANLVGGLGGLGQSSRSTGPAPNAGLNALGGASIGASLAGAGALGGLGAGAGAGLGALLAFL